MGKHSGQLNDAQRASVARPSLARRRIPLWGDCARAGRRGRLRLVNDAASSPPNHLADVSGALNTSELSLRQREWASTMRGHGSEVRFAHRDGAPALGAAPALTREQREDVEVVTLARGATRSHGAGDRPNEEEPDPYRTCFDRDRDRILHCAPFRRLAGKTQVFVTPNDHQRTRLTHALEVAQVARSIATACRANVSLAEAIAIGHDCGHGPGGHASEDAFDPYLPGGFHHAEWGADVTLVPLNLCAQTTDGIRNHSWSRPSPLTPEGEIVSWADRIAYVCHDFEDAALAGIVSPNDLPASVRELCGTTRSSQLGSFIRGVVVTVAVTGHVGMAPDLADALAAFRKFNYERIYLRPASVRQADAVIKMLRALTDWYLEEPLRLPVPVTSGGELTVVREVIRYVGGMTDRYACMQAVEHLGWDRRQLPVMVASGE